MIHVTEPLNRRKSGVVRNVPSGAQLDDQGVHYLHSLARRSAAAAGRQAADIRFQGDRSAVAMESHDCQPGLLRHLAKFRKRCC